MAWETKNIQSCTAAVDKIEFTTYRMPWTMEYNQFWTSGMY